MRRRTLVAGLALGVMAAGAGPALAGTPGGNGAQKSALTPTSSDGTNNCNSSKGTVTNGWAILNKTGRPATALATYQGEVHLTGATPNTNYAIFLGQAGGSGNTCTLAGTLQTNGEGIGNGHIPAGVAAKIGNGQYFVVLTLNAAEVYASSPVPLI